MGIEPTGPGSHRGPTGFEDQARHQTRSASERANYNKTKPPGFGTRPDRTRLALALGLRLLFRLGRRSTSPGNSVFLCSGMRTLVAVCPTLVCVLFLQRRALGSVRDSPCPIPVLSPKADFDGASGRGPGSLRWKALGSISVLANLSWRDHGVSSHPFIHGSRPLLPIFSLSLNLSAAGL